MASSVLMAELILMVRSIMLVRSIELVDPAHRPAPTRGSVDWG
jgi:hypothetical protein